MLNNGIVLIAGGDDVNDHPTASAELYNPATGTFTSTGSLITALDVHTATLLNNGFVLIANGGISSELYNPATGSFMATGIMATPRGGHSATLLSNGMVLIVGGDLYRSAELYNPATGVFTATGNTNVEHSYHTATLLNNGLVLISGGTTGNTIAELYTPSTGVFSLTGSLNSGRQFSSATLLNDGKVLIAGGSKNIGLVTFYASTEVYDPTTGVFTPGGNMTSARESHSATLLNNGTVLLAGGDNGTTALASAEIYDPATSTSTLVANMSTPRDYHTATLLGNGQILVAAGLRSTTTTSAGSSAELFTPGGLIPSGLTSISLAPVNPSVPAGGGLSFSATGTLSNNSTQTLASAQWSSSNSSVVTITNDSKNHANALAVAPGSATIRACAGSICGATTITVTSQPPAPSITSLSPSLGTDNISVTITGQNFGSSQGTSVVSFNGAPATVTSWNPTSIIVTVPVGATSGNVVVTAYGVTSNGVYFTDAPVISTLSLTSAPTMGLLTITGTGFASSQGTSTVTFNGTPATSFLDWNKSSIILRIPSGATAGNLIVTVNGVASNGVFFTPTPPPSITSLSPTSGMVGDSVTITGANFGSSQGSNAVRLYYTLGRVTVSNPASVTSWNATTIVVTVPIRTSGSGNPTVKVLVDGIASNGVNFTLLLPTIASLSPTSGPVGTSVTITGSNFRSTQGSSTVTFNGTLASPTNWSATSIVVPVPLGATTGAVVVTVNGQAGNGVTFTVQ